MSEAIRSVEIFDWDREGSERLRNANFRLLDTTLRDGVQTPGIKQPSLEDKMAIIDYDVQLGINAIDICLPSDPKTRYFQEGVECAKYIRATYPQIEIVVLTPTIQASVDATLLFAEQAGVKLSSILFRGSSDLRLLAEDWNEDEVIEGMHRFAQQLTGNGHRVISATEDSTRTRPEFLKEIFLAGKSGGASEFCIADTVGYADPTGVAKQIEWLRQEVAGSDGLQIQYHGHDDTRNAVSNSIAAIKAGADTVHVTWLGVGERAGNTSVEGVLSDLERRGANKYDLSCLVEGSKLVARSFGIDIPRNHPLVGEMVFRSGTGIHVAAVHKARQQGLRDIEGIVYAAVDPSRVNRRHEVAISPQGGDHSVQWVLEEMDIECTPERVKALLYFARAKNAELTDKEIRGVIRELEINRQNGLR